MHQRAVAAEFPGPQRIIEVLQRGVDEFGERELIVTPTRRMTYAQVDDASRTLAKSFIGAGLGKGTRIAAHLPNGPEWLVTFFAAARIGALCMPFSAAYKPAELRRALRLGDVHLLVGSTESWHGGPYADFLQEAVPELAVDVSPPLRCTAVPHLREVWLYGDGNVPSWARAVCATDVGSDDVSDELLAAVEDEVVPADDALVIWTSGTTADPKGAIHSQGTIARRAKANAYSHAFVLEDRVFCDFVFWWVGGPGYGFLPAMWVGATTLVVPKHDRETTEDFLKRERPTRVAGRLSTDIAERVVATSEGSSHMTTPRGIGMTETFGPHSMFEPEPLADTLAQPRNGLGPPILGFERRIVDPETGRDVPNGDEGELLVRGPGMMRDLYRRERADVLDADGWYHTGDRCFVEDRIIHFISRYTEMIKTSGSNVAPLEVEIVLHAMPEVEEAVVFGLPDPARGQQVVAVVHRAAGAAVDEEKVRSFVHSQLSNYKVPRRVLILDEEEMPRLHSGKPDKDALKRMIEEVIPMFGKD